MSVRRCPAHHRAMKSLFADCLNMYCSYQALASIARFSFGKHHMANMQQLPASLPRVLALVIDRDTDTDNRTCALNFLSNIAMCRPSLVLAENEAVACALRVVREQGTGAILLLLGPFSFPADPCLSTAPCCCNLSLCLPPPPPPPH
jgi:hypothetical protein